MKLPFKLPFEKKTKSDFFLSLVLRDEKISAVVFEEFSAKVKILTENDEQISGSIESLTIEELLEIFDKLVSKIEDKLPSSVEIQKTIFGVKENWVFENKIKKEYLLKLKKISDELGLEPIGFLVIPEAITHFLSKEEGAPVSAILVEVGNKKLNASLIRAGRIIETKEAEIKESIAHTTDIVLHHFIKQEVLPSRIIIYDGKKDDLVQEFIGHIWSKNLPFLHVPQVTALPKDFDAKSVLFGAASQMGFEFVKQDKVEEIKESITEKVEKVKEEKESEEENDVIKEDIQNESEDFGFVKDVDVATKSDKTGKKTNYEVTKKEIETAPKLKNESNQKNVSFSSRLKLINSFISNFLSIIKKFPILSTFKNIHFSFSFPSFKKKVILIPPVFLIFCITLFVIYILNVKSTITLYVNPKNLDENKKVTFSIDGSDFSKNIISSEAISVSETGALSTPATGKKEVGEKAKGTITIYSNLTKEQSLAKGATIISSNDLEFTLDESIKIASISGASDGPKTTKVNIVAKNIGKEYNLPSGTKFTIDTLDSSLVEGKNENAFSGGSKKEITVISNNDVNKLLTQLPKDLEEKAKEDITQKISSNKVLFPIEISGNIIKKDFDANINDEAKTLTIKGTVEYKGFAYQKEDLENYTKSVYSDKLQNMILAKDKVNFSLENVEQKKKSDDITADLKLKISLLPKIEKENLIKNLTGLSFEQAKSVLLKTPQTDDVTISLSPSIPFIPKMLPRFPNNIDIIIKTNE